MRRHPAILAVCALSAALNAGCGRGGTNDAAISSAKPPPASLTVLHLGDSHTAADHFSGHLRALFQERFGRGARGMLPPGAIYRGYHPNEVALHTTGEWRLFDAWHNPEDGPYGLSGYRLTGSRPDAALTYEVAAPDRFTRVRLGVYGGPGSGSLVLREKGGESHTISTRSARPGYALKTVALGRAVTRITLSPAGDGPVSLLSIALERTGGGVTYVSHGVPGATVELLARMDEEIVKRELHVLHPDLIILAFGTNEGFDDSLDEAAYKRLFDAQVRRLQRLAPGARIAIAGPPDADRLSARGHGKAKGGPRPCVVNPSRAGADGRRLSTYWSVPGMLEKVRQTQKQVAEARGLTFWDWSSVMGGKCGMTGWANAVPPKAFADHVHMTDAGAAESAQQFFDALMNTYGDDLIVSPHAEEKEVP